MKQLRVLHFPQVPCDPFKVSVESLDEAKKVMDMLADYDLFQFEHKIKPDYANTTILEELDEVHREWVCWGDEETGITDLDEYLEHMKEVAIDAG